MKLCVRMMQECLLENGNCVFGLLKLGEDQDLAESLALGCEFRGFALGPEHYRVLTGRERRVLARSLVVRVQGG